MTAAVHRYRELDGVFIHDEALVESPSIGEGTRIWAFAHVMPDVTVGVDCNICDGAFLESGAKVGNHVTVKNHVLIWDRVDVHDYVFLGPNVVFTNDLRPRVALKKGRDGFMPTVVKAHATIGANSTIVCGTTIGSYAFVAAGALVHRDVADHALVLGNPGRAVGYVCACGERVAVESTDAFISCQHCGTGLMCTDHGMHVVSLGSGFIR